LKAIFIISTLERDALKFGQALTWRTEGELRDLARDCGLDVEVEFVIQDPLLAGRNKAGIGIAAIREERPRLLDAISAAAPDLVVCFGPVAAACVLGHGNLREDDLVRRRHEPFGPDGPPVYYVYGLENVRARPGLKQWWHLDLKAAIAGYTEPVYGEYTYLRPGTDDWDLPWKSAHAIGYWAYDVKELGWDCETTGLVFWHPEARLRMMQISDRVGRAWVIQGTPDSRFPQWLLDILADPNIRKVGSNIKFDVKWARRFGIEVNNFADSGTREHIIDSSQPYTDLKRLTFKYLPRLADYSKPQKEYIKQVGGGSTTVGWAVAEDEPMFQYAAADAEASLAAYLGQVGPLASLERPRKLYEELYPVLADMEYQGVRVDTAINLELDSLYTERLRDVRARIAAQLGPVNLNSASALAGALLDAVPGLDLSFKDWKNLVGNEESPELSTRREILERESHKSPVIQDVLEYRRLRTRHTNFIKKVREKHLVEHHGHSFIHASFRTDLVETYRLSCTEPNMMNIPRKDFQTPELSVKRQFVSRWDGGQMLEVDQSQVEIRFAAWASGDAAMQDAVASGRDIHTEMASILLAKPAADITEQERYECKTRTFLIMYGGGAKKLAEQLMKSDVNPRKVTKDEAWKMIRDYFATFRGLKAHIDDTHDRAWKELAVETAFGFRRTFAAPVTREDKWSLQRQAFNTKVQSGAACLTYCAMIVLQNALRERNLQSKMVVQVHDSLLIDVHPDEVNVLPGLAKWAMEQGAVEKAREFGVEFAVDLKADVKMGDSWGNMAEVK